MKFLPKFIPVIVMPVALFLLLGIGEGSWVMSIGGASDTVTLSERQYLVFPVVLLVLIHFFLTGRKAILASTLVLAPCIVWAVQFSLSSSAPSNDTSVVFAKLAKDPRESFTLRLREQMNRFLPAEVDTVTGDSRSIRTHKAALKRYPSAPAIVWGDRDAIKISFQESASQVSRFIVGDLPEPVELLFIENVPGVEISFEPVQQTGMFVAGLISVLETLRFSRMVEYPGVEDRLLALGLHQSTWSNFAHLALPWFYLGNLYFEQSFESGGESLLQKCALNAYTEAAARVQPREHPLLRASIFNNKAVTLMMRGGRPTKEEAVEIRKLLRGANMMVSQPTKGWRPRKYVRGAIRENLLALKQLKNPGGKKRQSRRKKE